MKVIDEAIGKANKLYNKQIATGKVVKFCCDTSDVHFGRTDYKDFFEVILISPKFGGIKITTIQGCLLYQPTFASYHQLLSVHTQAVRLLPKHLTHIESRECLLKFNLSTY